jgi:hypothetical protein
MAIVHSELDLNNAETLSWEERKFSTFRLKTGSLLHKLNDYSISVLPGMV